MEDVTKGNTEENNEQRHYQNGYFVTLKSLYYAFEKKGKYKISPLE